MDILLSHGFFLRENAGEQRIMRPHPPLGLLCLSAYLKSVGFSVQIFDSTFSDRAAFAACIERERPRLVGLYANLMTRSTVVDLIGVCRAAGATVICGGPEPANYADEYLASGADIVVIGEGELTLEELLHWHRRPDPGALAHIAGIAYRDGDRVVRTGARKMIRDLDTLPFPDRDAIDLRQYLDAWRGRHGAGSVSLVTSRGCPFTCTWCSHAVYGHSHRSRSPGHVADEVALIQRTYRPELLWYADDVFTLNRRWVFDYAAELARRGLVAPFETISREDRLDDEVIEVLAAMGCRRLWIGCESGSQRILDAMRRRTDASRVPGLVRQLQAHGIEAGLFIMLGFPGEEASDLEATGRLLREARPDVFLSTVAYPIKGTPFHDDVQDRLASAGAWQNTSDNQLRVRGQHSRRFYGHASRWMAGEAAWSRRTGRPAADLWRRLRALANRQVGRAGMRLTRHQVE